MNPTITAPHARRARLWTAALFFAALGVYAASPVVTAFDSRWTIHTAMSLLRGQGGSLAAYGPVLEANRFYAISPQLEPPRTIYPVGVSLLAAPAVLLMATLDPSFEPKLRFFIPARFEHWLASVIAAAAAALFFRLLLREFGSIATALAGTLCFALGSTMWSDASRALWQHGPLVLSLVLAMLALQRERTVPLASAMRETAPRSLPLAYAAIVLATIGLYAQWAVWWGGHCYGPRLLTDIVPFLAFFASYAFDDVKRQPALWRKAGAAFLVLPSVAIQAPGALSWRSWLWNVDPVNVDEHTARLWDWRDPPFLRALR